MATDSNRSKRTSGEQRRSGVLAKFSVTVNSGSDDTTTAIRYVPIYWLSRLVLPLLLTERGAQITFVIHSSLLLLSGVYAQVDVFPAWLQVLSPLSPMTYVLHGRYVPGLLEGA